MKSIFLTVVCFVGSMVFAQEKEGLDLSLGSYGELHWNAEKQKMDFHRFVAFGSYAWNDEWSFKAAMAFKQSFADNAWVDKLELEQGYINYDRGLWGFKGGVLLAPVGIINLYHEPPTFLSVRRPEYAKYIIPTTWFGSGFGFYGSLAGVEFGVTMLEDLQGKNLLVSNNPITKEYMESLGVKTTQRREVENDISLGDTLDARDTTYIRYPEATNFLKTNHSLFLTDIITNLDFYNSLTENEQEIFKQVALEVARTERKETTQEAKDFENTAKEKGCDIIELSQKEQEIMKAKAKELYKKWESKYFPGLINGIQKA